MPFKCNLQRYDVLTGFVNVDNAKLGCAIRNKRALVGRCRFELI